MNRCERWNICPLGDITKYLGCRKAWCHWKALDDWSNKVAMRMEEANIDPPGTYSRY